ncbi:MAG: immunoglobulin domain-containing protein, partial [Limisphaerales bacterium]
MTTISTNQPDAFVTKYDGNGNVLWAKSQGGLVVDSALSVSADFARNTYLSGYFYRNAKFDWRPLQGAGAEDMFVSMYDATGKLIKVRRGGGGGRDVGAAIIPDGRGNVIVGGSSTSGAVFGETILPHSGGLDGFVAKVNFFSPDLPPLLTSQPLGVVTGFGSNATFTVGLTSSSAVSYQWFLNGVAVAGATNGFLSISNANYSSFGNYSLVISNAYGAVTSAVASLTMTVPADVAWTLRLGSTGDDQGLATVVDAHTNVYVAGVFSGTVAFGSSNLVSAGSTDIFL